MKKLMIAAAIVCAAAFTQAAQLKWSLSGVTAKETTDTTGYQAYFFIASDSSGSTDASKILTVVQAEAYAAAGNISALESAAAMTASLGNKGSVTSNLTPANADWVKNTEVKSFAIIFNNKDATAATYYTVGLDTDEEPAVLAYMKFSSDTAKSTATIQQASAWAAVSAVPEPTSGLLLLLGVAGLALRRKRA